jgi:hypothetical protein
MKSARFLIWNSGKSAMSNANALGGYTELTASIYLDGCASRSGALSRLLRPRAMSRPAPVTLVVQSMVETVLSAPPKRVGPRYHRRADS